MGKIRDCLICGYFDESKDYIVEVNTEKLQQVINKDFPEYKDFLENDIEKIEVYSILKKELGRDNDYNHFIIDFK